MPVNVVIELKALRCGHAAELLSVCMNFASAHWCCSNDRIVVRVYGCLRVRLRRPRKMRGDFVFELGNDKMGASLRFLNDQLDGV